MLHQRLLVARSWRSCTLLILSVGNTLMLKQCFGAAHSPPSRIANPTMTRHWEQRGWVEHYNAAVLEMNPTKMAARIGIAESAIKARIADISSDPAEEELIALKDALRVLRLLEKQEPGSGLAS
jgi:hypothetical protein